jgi:hypothetical protein
MTRNADAIARDAIVRAAEKDRRDRPRRCHLCDKVRVPAFVSTDDRSICGQCIKTEPAW